MSVAIATMQAPSGPVTTSTGTPHATPPCRQTTTGVGAPDRRPGQSALVPEPIVGGSVGAMRAHPESAAMAIVQASVVRVFMRLPYLTSRRRQLCLLRHGACRRPGAGSRAVAKAWDDSRT